MSVAAHLSVLEWGSNRWNYEMVCVPYDFNRLKDSFIQSELIKKAIIWPKCILNSIESGVNMGPNCAKRAYDLAMIQEEIFNMAVPEKYWKEAAKELGLIV